MRSDKASGAIVSRVVVVSTTALLALTSTLFAQVVVNTTVEPGKDRPGLNYSSYETDGGPDTCRNDCARDAKCQAYTWVRQGVQRPKAVCWLKHGATAPVDNGDCVSGVKWSLPKGLTGGLSYWVRGGVADIGSVDGIATLVSDGRRTAKAGWRNVSDGDIVASTNHGFYHQEFLAEGAGVASVPPDRLRLPAGAACGFRHTLNSLDSTESCMGVDPGKNTCPVGWTVHRHFDMGSGDGEADCNTLDGLVSGHCHYFVWCEYNDPYHLCEDADCIKAAALTATIGISSNTDASGHTQRAQCPPGTTRTAFYDQGRGAGEGLSFCLNAASQTAPAPTTGGLTGTFAFDVQSGVSFTIAVTFKGDIVEPRGTDGVRTFTKTVTSTGIGTGITPQNVGFTVHGLMVGTWRVSASSTLTGPVLNCTAQVPGFVGLSVAGGQGPRCY